MHTFARFNTGIPPVPKNVVTKATGRASMASSFGA